MPIVKKTKKQVFVLQDTFGEKCYALDRQKLETEGYCYARRLQCYYTTPWAERHRRFDPSDNVRELRQKLAAAHPDHGGNPAEFKRLRAEYEALAG